MDSPVLNIVLLGIAVAILPAPIIITLLLLQSRGGLSKATAFVAGGIAVRIVQGIVFGLVVESTADKYGEAGPPVVKSTLLLVLGILLLIAAYKKWRKEEDPDAPPPKWMAAVGDLSTVKALGVGALLVGLNAKQWVFTLSAISAIADANLGPAQGAIAYALYVVVAAILLLLPILAAVLAPQRSGAMLARARSWLEDNNRTIAVIASLVFGLLFLYQGLTGLLG
jgi:hypothetical protein